MRYLMLLLPVLLAVGSAAAHPGPAHGPQPAPAAPELLSRVGPDQAKALAGDLENGRRPEDELYELIGAAKTGEKVLGNGTCLIILLQWADHPADTVAHPAADYDAMLFSTATWPTGSMNDFYLENSYGLFGVQGLVSGWHTDDDAYASITPTDYGQVRDLLADAVADVDPFIDFSQYDNDGPDGIPDSGDDDGYVDSLFFVHAGPGREQTGDSNDIWSHAWAFAGGVNTNDGVACYRYTVEPEMLSDGSLMTMGVFAHEYGHVLGLPDLYDTDYSSSGIGNWGLMSGGSWGRRPGDPVGSAPSHMTAWCKKELGWLTPVNVTSDLTGVSIPPAETSATAYRLWRGGVVGDEYFLIENRRRLGFDESLVRRQVDYGLAAPEGLVIYHVDESISGNSNEKHRLVDVVEASPWYDTPSGTWMEHLDGERDYATVLKLHNPNRGDDGDLWPGYSLAAPDSTSWMGPRDRDRFAADTIPAALDHECQDTGVSVENIALSGEDVLADLLVGPVAKARVAPDKALSWTFETDADGWKFCNGYVHWDDTVSGSCSGDGGLWFGVDDPEYACGPGYGNDWEDFTWQTVALSQGATITLRHRYDLESGYDYAVVEVRCAASPESPWHEVAALTGVASCVTDTWLVPAAVFSECEPGDGVAVVDIRLRLSTDGAYSADDGNFCGDGWWVDEVAVTGEIVTDVADTAPSVVLAAPMPNPFNPSTTLRFRVPAAARDVALTVVDQRGRVVRTLDAPAGEGWLEASWDGRDDRGRELPGGVYFARLAVDGELQVRKLALLK
ncbi:MAG TPA: M6 family metalloprotease domain-containing protein [Candidatus Krumholzibacteria bacterium]|nr:M6 family metalloprotease domain-containing protein [Candidatus Krumholzibacteria bacterium]HRX52178.1 M6 family metalloprotease domain-containing protein [Candidatus Krumholzibacteria bacterium]